MTTARERSFCPPLITRQEALGVTLTNYEPPLGYEYDWDGE